MMRTNNSCVFSSCWSGASVCVTDSGMTRRAVFGGGWSVPAGAAGRMSASGFGLLAPRCLTLPVKGLWLRLNPLRDPRVPPAEAGIQFPGQSLSAGSTLIPLSTDSTTTS